MAHSWVYGVPDPAEDAPTTSHATGVCVLRKFENDKILWGPCQVDTTHWQSDPAVLKTVTQNRWVVWGLQVLTLLGHSTPPHRGDFILEYGSSTTVAWVREDLKIIKGTQLLPKALGVITLSQGGGPLSEALSSLAESAPVLQKVSTLKALNLLKRLFNPRDLAKPAFQVSLPGWSILETVFLELGIEKSLEIARTCFRVVETHSGNWADFIAVLRFVIAQLLNQIYLPLQIPLAIVSIEDLFLCSSLEEMTATEYLELLRSIMNPFFWDRAVRAFNYFCSRCNEWHYLDSKGQSLWFKGGKGGTVKKKCRLNYQNQTVSKLLREGAGLSGAGIYLAEGLLGKTGQHVFLARNYSRGNVFKVLGPFFENPSNGAFALPVGAFYFYGQGCNPKISLDSLAFLEILLENPKPVEVVSKVMDALPVPYSKERDCISIEISLDGKVQVH